MSNGKGTSRRAKVAERRRKALELRRAGATWQEIADQLGYKRKSQACDDVTRALEQVAAEPAQDVLATELSRLDALTQSLWSLARRGDLQAVDRVLKIMERRAKYLGLDAPARHEVITLDAIDAEIARLEQQLGTGTAAEAAQTEGPSGQG